MPDDGKGEDKISAKPKTRRERMRLNQVAAQTIAHRRRQAAGTTPSANREPWARDIERWHKHGKIMRGQA